MRVAKFEPMRIGELFDERNADDEIRWPIPGHDSDDYSVKTHGWNSKREGIGKHAWAEGELPSPVATF